MILYKKTKLEFLRDGKYLSDILKASVEQNLGVHPSEAEVLSWKRSLFFVHNLLKNAKIPQQVGIILEYNLPASPRRIDLMLTGKNSQGEHRIILVELKQWDSILPSALPNMVKTFYQGGELKEVMHPSAQVLEYELMLQTFNGAVHARKVSLRSCVYAHNCVDKSELSHVRHKEILQRAPVFYKGEEERLVDYICNFIQQGDNGESAELLEKAGYSLENILVKQPNYGWGDPSKMLPRQKESYDSIISVLDTAIRQQQKHVVVVSGGSGSGKTAVAQSLFLKMMEASRAVNYVAKNRSSRWTMQEQMCRVGLPKAAQWLVASTNQYALCVDNTFNMLIVDEAQCVWLSQIKDLVRSALVSVFFVDEHKMISWRDAGTVSNISACAQQFGANYHRIDLSSSAEKSDSDYFAWLEQLLYSAAPCTYRSNSNFRLELYDDPCVLYRELLMSNLKNNKSRFLAGLCEPWAQAVSIPEYNISIPWMSCVSRSDITNSRVKYAGKVFTCQGVTLEYAGVFIGSDLVYRDGKIQTDLSQHLSSDTLLPSDPALAQTTDMLIRNAYYLLLSRAEKGGLLYVQDIPLRDYLKSLILKK